MSYSPTAPASATPSPKASAGKKLTKHKNLAIMELVSNLQIQKKGGEKLGTYKGHSGKPETSVE